MGGFQGGNPDGHFLEDSRTSDRPLGLRFGNEFPKGVQGFLANLTGLVGFSVRWGQRSVEGHAVKIHRPEPGVSY